jgi:lysophospholipase L1-like esterase
MSRIALACALLLFTCSSLTGAAQVKIACVGDSITEGSGLRTPAMQSYPARLQRLLGTNYLTRNYGVSGRTLLKQGDFPYWKEAFFKQSHDFEPDIVIIQLGTNDSKPQNWKYGTNFVSDYEKLIASYATLTNSPRVVVCTPCPVYANGAYNIRPGVVATNIAPMIRDIASRHSLRLIDLHARMAGHGDLFPDTVHPNSSGMAVMAAVMFDELRSDLRIPEPTNAARLGIRAVPSARVELSWPSNWGSLVAQTATAVKPTNMTWTISDAAIPVSNSTGLIQLTNASTGAPRFFRLWKP